MRSHVSFIGILAATGASRAFRLASRQDAPSFDWSSVPATSDFKNLTSCFDGFKCGRLSVPLDYTRKDGPKAIIAAQVWPATDKANYQGVILLNPGGPGGSGTDAINQFGPLLSQVVGPGYDVIGFDPRGVGATIPNAKCFSTEAWAQFEQSEQFVLENKQDLAYARARDTVVAQKCSSALGGTGKEDAKGTLEQWGGGRFMDTGSVANDMLSIARAFGQDKVNYIGISYGTVLGEYFASMFPNNVGLMLLDGVVDAQVWRNAEFAINVRDADKVMQKFFELCTQVGPAGCAVASKTVNQTAARVSRIIDSLKTKPVSVLAAPAGPVVITYDAVREFIRPQIYEPLTGFSTLADVFGAIETNNQTTLANVWAPSPATGLPAWYPADQAEAAIECLDFVDLSKTTPDGAMKILETATRSSKWIGSVWARFILECIPWKMKAKNRYTGPLSAKKLSGKLLVISNRYDPVTPLSHARATQSRYGNSSLLVQETVGHTAFLSLSSCAAQAIGAFFQAGILPGPGTVCQPDELPLVGPVTPNPTPGHH